MIPGSLESDGKKMDLDHWQIFNCISRNLSRAFLSVCQVLMVKGGGGGGRQID